MATFSVFVSKADFRFNCAHFIAYKGFRERLHGHNYRLSIRITGSETIGDDGYVIDFGDIKKATRKLCKALNEYFICPMKSDALEITEIDNQVCLVCEDGSKFSFPRKDVMMLPLLHSSAEELSHYFWCKIIREIGLADLLKRGAKHIEVSVAEAPLQMATYACDIPKNEEELAVIETSCLRRKPRPCLKEDIGENGENDEEED